MCPRQGLKRELVARHEDQITIRDMEEHRSDNRRTNNWVKDQEVIYRNQMPRRNERQNIENRNYRRSPAFDETRKIRLQKPYKETILQNHIRKEYF